MTDSMQLMVAVAIPLVLLLVRIIRCSIAEGREVAHQAALAELERHEAERQRLRAVQEAWIKRVRWLREVHLPLLREHPCLFHGTRTRDSITGAQEHAIFTIQKWEGDLGIDVPALSKREASAVIGMFRPPEEHELNLAADYGIEVVPGMSQSEIEHEVAVRKLNKRQACQKRDNTERAPARTESTSTHPLEAP